MPKAESRIQNQILRYLTSLPQCIAFKVILANQRGVPDILCCLNGRFIGFEVKRFGAKPTPIQHAQHQRIAAAGGVVYVVRSIDEIQTILSTLNSQGCS